jgi:hypothetical protein
MTESLAPNIVRHGDYLIDADTGEIVDMVLPQQEAPFMVHDQQSAEWVLQRIFEAEAEVAAIRKRREVLLSNLAAMEAEHQRRVDWLRRRFSGELEAHAEVELEGKKQRSIRTPFGTLAFRRKPSRVVVTDEDKAVEFCEAVGYENVVKVTKKVLVSMLPDSFAAADAPGFDVEPESDGFSIKTGLL